MKKKIFGTVVVALASVSLLISDNSYSNVSVEADAAAPVETIEETSTPVIPDPVQIKKIDREVSSENYTMNATITIPEPEPVIEEIAEPTSTPSVANESNKGTSASSQNDQNNSSKPVNEGSSDNKNNSSKQEAPQKKKSDVIFNDNIAGKLADPAHVPCGGLWEYYYDNFYAREINCSGSGIYLDISKGQKITIAGKTCTMVGSQNLNYHSNTMGDVVWYGNTIVQTCYYGNRGKVRLVNFNCD